MYNVEIETGDKQVEALDSPVYIQMYGTTTATPKLFFESKLNSFAQDAISKFTIPSNNVGEVSHATLKNENVSLMFVFSRYNELSSVMKDQVLSMTGT